MVDREKVRTQLAGIGIGLDMAGYHNDAQCVRDALALLREQEPRLLSVDEVKALPPDTDVYVENGTYDNGPRYLLAATKEGVGGRDGVSFFYFSRFWKDYNHLPYGWRVWTARPTKEQRRAVKWDD